MVGGRAGWARLTGRPTMTARKSPPLDMDRLFRELGEIQDELSGIQRRRRARDRAPPLWNRVDTDFPTQPKRVRVTLRLDEDVLAWFRAQGVGHQARMNAALRAYMLFKLAKLG
jgi:uncharacterized protein (DUF4415 family)